MDPSLILVQDRHPEAFAGRRYRFPEVGRHEPASASMQRVQVAQTIDRDPATHNQERLIVTVSAGESSIGLG